MSPHGLMFHHLHGGRFKAGEGSISAESFARIIDERKGVLGAEEWTSRRRNGTLEPHNVCITFDDALLCQHEIALPLLKERGLTAFWYVYTEALDGTADGFEIARHFRVSAFENFTDFFQNFRAVSLDMFPDLIGQSLNGFKPKDYLAAWAFYSDDERTYRFLRDRVLGNKVSQVITRMMRDRGFSKETERHRLWITREMLKDLSDAGHAIGLHSTSHPMAMSEIPGELQYEEYCLNMEDIRATTGVRPITMAHPCNSYSAETLDVLSRLGIEEGFCTVMTVPGGLESPRRDVANLQQ